MEIRLQKYMADCGVASRRGSEALIAEGVVEVNGKVVQVQGTRVDPEKDEVRVRGKRIQPVKTNYYYVFNKPVGYLTTVHDPQKRPTIYSLVPELKGKVIPVGRLDLNSEGLLLLTNDGDFAYRMTHPKFGIRKTYRVKVLGRVSETKRKELETGIQLEDGKTAPAKAKIVKTAPKTTTLDITLREGKKRQVRRMCEGIGHPVLNLRRVSIENLHLKGLEEGYYRPLTDQELMPLMHRIQLSFSKERKRS